MRGARISLWCAVLEALWTRSTSWTGMRCFSCRRGRPCAAFCSGRPRGSAAAAAPPTCAGYGMRTSSSYSGVLGAAGWSHDRAKRLRAGHDVVGSYRARTMEATRRRARPGPRTCYRTPHAKNASVLVRGSGSTMNRHTHTARARNEGRGRRTHTTNTLRARRDGRHERSIRHTHLIQI